AEHAPIEHAFDRHFDLDGVAAATELVAVKAPIGNLAGEHRRAGAFAAFGVRASADDGIAEHHGGGFHPGAMLALHRDVTGEIGRARLHDLDPVIGDRGFVLLLMLEHLAALAERVPLLRIDATL